MNDPAAAARLIARDPGAFMQQMDPLQQRALFLRVSEADLRSASFLDDRMGMQGREGFWLPLDSLSSLASIIGDASPAPDFIFHIGHCGSTLLSRLLDEIVGTLGLREPLVLRELAALERELDTPLARMSRERWMSLFVDTLTILGRPFSTGQRVVVKATSNCNNLIEPLLTTHSQVRAVLLHMPLESYLATMAKAPGGGLDALHTTPARLQFLHRYLDDDSLRLYHMDSAESLAMGWIAELSRFNQLVGTPALQERLQRVDFETLLANPGLQLTAVKKHLQLPGEALDDDSVMKLAVMRGYAKSPTHPYTPSDRKHDLDQSRQRFGAEIARGMRWAWEFVERHEKLRPLASMLQ